VRWGLGIGIVLAVASGPAVSAPEAHHTVRPGETLWDIAALTVGDPTLWPALYRANRDQIKDPAVLYPGQTLTIPAIDPDELRAERQETEPFPAK
jgi:nucleoid-associated protein YgaU